MKGQYGYIISVTDNTAKVQTIIDSSSSVTANLNNTDDSIVCKGSLNDKMLKATYIPTSADISEGDTIETSGMGGIYPKGVIIRKSKKHRKYFKYFRQICLDRTSSRF